MYTVNGCLFVVITCVSFQVWQAATEDERSRYKQFSDTLASLEELWYTLWGFYTPPIFICAGISRRALIYIVGFYTPPIFICAGISKRTLMSDIHCGVFIPPQSLIYPFSLFSPSDQGLKRNMLLEFWFWNICALKMSASAKPWWQQSLRARKEIFWNFGSEIFVPQYQHQQNYDGNNHPGRRRTQIGPGWKIRRKKWLYFIFELNIILYFNVVLYFIFYIWIERDFIFEHFIHFILDNIWCQTDCDDVRIW